MHNELADLADCDVAHLVVDDTGHGEGHLVPDRRKHRRVAVQGGEVRLGAEVEDVARQLGHAEAGGELDARQLLHQLLQHLGRHGRCSVSHVPQARQVVATERRVT